MASINIVMAKDVSVENYFYNEQFRKAIIQFMAIFSGMKVSTGKNDYNSASNLIEVPVLYGSRDRVVSHIFSEQTQNKLVRLPMMTAQVLGVSLARDRLAGQGTERNEIKLKRGGMIPDDLQHHKLLKPVPYEVTMELAINTTNTDHQFQMLEQIFLLFNPSLQIQVADNYGNTSSIVEVFLQTISFDENYPAGTDNRMISTAILFEYVLYLSAPVDLRDEIIKSIQVRIANVDDPCDINDSGVDPFIINTDGAPTS